MKSDEAFARKDPRGLERVAIGELVPISHWDDVLPPGDTFRDWGLKVVEEVVAPMGTVFVRVIYDQTHD
jgi:hypothetical protein